MKVKKDQKLFGERETMTTEQRLATVNKASPGKKRGAYSPSRDNDCKGGAPCAGGGGKRG